MIVVARR